MTIQEAENYLINKLWSLEYQKNPESETTIALNMAIMCLEAWDILQTEIRKLKVNQECENQDYYTGFMSALSIVEGIMAIYELSLKIKEHSSVSESKGENDTD